KKLGSGDLPSEFALDKYLFTKELDGSGWATALDWRRRCKSQIEIAEQSPRDRAKARFATQCLIETPEGQSFTDSEGGWRPTGRYGIFKSAVSDYSAIEFLDLTSMLNRLVAAEPLMQQHALSTQSRFQNGVHRPEVDEAVVALSSTPHWRLSSNTAP